MRCKAFPENADILQVAKGTATLIKKDIFRNLMWYVLPQSNKQYPITIERVRKIRSQNMQNIVPEELEAVEVVSTKPKDVEPEFVDVVGQISLRSLDKADKKKRERNREAQRPQRATGGQSQGNRPALKNDGQQRPPAPQQKRPQQQQRPQGGAQQRPQGNSQRLLTEPAIAASGHQTPVGNSSDRKGRRVRSSHAGRKVARASKRKKADGPGECVLSSVQSTNMIRTIQLILLVASATIFSCDHLKKHLGMKEEEKTETPTTKTLVADADKIENSHYGPTVAPVYNRGYTITVTPDELLVTIKSYDSVLLTKKRSFTDEQFKEVLNKFKGLKKRAEPESGEYPLVAALRALYFIKAARKIFTGNNYGGQAKNYNGADIDLSYLVPDVEVLVEGTRKKGD